MYAKFLFGYLPLKSEPFRVRLTVGGDRIKYPYNGDSPKASLFESKYYLISKYYMHTGVQDYYHVI